MGDDLKNCLACHKPLRGRSDKKFCDDYCRNAYNNQLRIKEPPAIKKIILILKNNRKILADLLGEENMIKKPKEKFLTLGFLFDYHTHIYKNKNGNIYFFCFEYGFLPLENDWFLIVKRNK
ncbi:MAG: hypothetical protein JSS67_05365 [Bacteroidetes bacterium]|nr:hypothetical protein [Bacteroidota bacterium]